MKNILVIGMGRFGRYTVRKLTELGHAVMAVDKKSKRIDKIVKEATSVRIGNATDKEFLSTLGIKNFDVCMVCIGDAFLEALEVTSYLKELGAAQVISRATSSAQETFLLRNGADAVVFPEKQMANWTAIRYSSNHIENYIEVSDGYSIYEVQVPIEWDGKQIDEINVRRKYGFNILGVRGEKMIMNPAYDTVLHKDETMLVLGKDEELQKYFKMKK